jgi:hypothetical protein
MPIRARHLATALSAVTALIAPASAQAVGWVTGAPLSPQARLALSPMVALAPSGERIVAWQQEDGNGTSEAMVVRTAPLGGGFGASQQLPVSQPSDASLTVGSDGTAALVWLDSTFTQNSEVEIARRAPGQTSFQEMRPFPLGATSNNAPAVTVQGGDVYVAQDTIVEQASTITTSVRALRLAAGSSTPEALDGPAESVDHETYTFTPAGASTTVADPSIAVSGGVVRVAWDHLFDAGTTGAHGLTLVRTASRPVGSGSFSTPTQLDSLSRNSSFADAATPRLAAGPGGTEAVWIREDAQQLVYQNLSRAGSAPATLSVGQFPEDLHAELDRSGALVLAFDAFTNPDDVEGVFTDVVSAGGASHPPQRLTAPNASRRLVSLSVGPDGSAVALSDRSTLDAFEDADEQVQAYFRAPGAGSFGAAEEVSGTQDRTGNATFDSPGVAAGAGGQATVAWNADDHSGVPNDRMFISQRDPSAPALSLVRVPARARVGATVAMSAAASDSLSPVAVDWDFGDGAVTRGPAVAHRFGAPGLYRVTVSARSAVGNVATQVHTIRVTGVAPVVTRLRLTHRRFRAARAMTALIAAARGTVFKLNVTERSTVVISLTRRAGGRRVATIVRAGRGPGAVSVPFSGRVAGIRLAPGAYVASVTAIGVFGNRSRARAVSFTVLPG